MTLLPAAPPTARPGRAITRCFAVLALFLGGIIALVTIMPGKPFKGLLPSLTAGEATLRDQLRGHIEVLAGDIGERTIWRGDSLAQAADYIEAAFDAMGYEMISQPWETEGVEVRNIIAETGGSGGEEVVVIGAHYDTVKGSPGADDNASGVAALIELARLAAGRRHDRPLYFAAFANEESPFFITGGMGSLQYAELLRQQGVKIHAMLSLESMGYFSTREKSQAYPFPFGLFYPATADFIAFVGNLSSWRLARETTGLFRRHAAFPAEGTAAPGWMPGIGWSDHKSFWQKGYPAVMVTDTAPFRNPDYHTPRDLPATIDYDRLARVTAGLDAVVATLAGRQP